ncbi:MAG: SRPBCC domain-containing protein [Steroidobacteraceae bacterium]
MSVRTRGYAHRVDIVAPPSRVWSALIEPALLARWFGPNPSVKPKAGGRFQATLDPGLEREALIDIFDVNRRLRLVYMTPSYLPPFEGAVVDDFLIEPEGPNTIVRLLGSGIPEGKLWDAHYVKLRAQSERALARLKLLMEKKVAPPSIGPGAASGTA